MISKQVMWKGIRSKCKDCLGDSPNDQICRDTKCPLHPYKGNPEKQRPDGKMLPVFYKPRVLKSIRRFCRENCLNGNPLSMCSSMECPLRKIVFNDSNMVNSDEFEVIDLEERSNPLGQGDDIENYIRVDGFSSNLATSA